MDGIWMYVILDGVGLQKRGPAQKIFGFVGHLKSGKFKKRENDDQSWSISQIGVFFLLLHLLSEGASNSKHLQNTSWYVSGFLMLSSYGALQVVCSSKLPLLEKPFLEVTKAHPRYWQPKAPANWPAKCSWSNAARHFLHRYVLHRYGAIGEKTWTQWRCSALAESLNL